VTKWRALGDRSGMYEGLGGGGGTSQAFCAFNNRIAARTSQSAAFLIFLLTLNSTKNRETTESARYSLGLLVKTAEAR
jgi:hypothetical protein